MRHKSSSNPKWHLSKAGAIITGAYTGSISEAVLISVWVQITTIHALTRAKHPHRSHLTCSTAPHQGKGGKGQGRTQL